MTFRRTVFLDCEATGLDARIHQVCELSWSVDAEEEVHTIVPPHDLTHADPRALEVNRYFERGLHLQTLSEVDWVNARAALCSDLTGAQIVAANPAFDAGMLTPLLGYQPWHHRLRDIEERAATTFGWEDSRSMSAIVAELRDRGYDIPENDHTAANDVRALRASWFALIEERKALTRVSSFAA